MKKSSLCFIMRSPYLRSRYPAILLFFYAKVFVESVVFLLLWAKGRNARFSVYLCRVERLGFRIAQSYDNILLIQ